VSVIFECGGSAAAQQRFSVRLRVAQSAKTRFAPRYWRSTPRRSSPTPADRTRQRAQHLMPARPRRLHARHVLRCHAAHTPPRVPPFPLIRHARPRCFHGRRVARHCRCRRHATSIAYADTTFFSYFQLIQPTTCSIRRPMPPPPPISFIIYQKRQKILRYKRRAMLLIRAARACCEHTKRRDAHER